MTYIIEFPYKSRIHLVFHISLLELYYKDNNLHAATLPTQFIEEKPLVKPINIIKIKIVLKENHQITELLV